MDQATVHALASATLTRVPTRIGEAMKRLRVEQNRSLTGHPDTWMVVELQPGRRETVVFRGTYCECLKRAEEIAKARPC
jgi:hypothetical protein